MEKKQYSWGKGLFLITYQTILLISLPFYFYYNTVSLGVIAWSIILLYLTGMSITAGYHRYFSHRTFKTNRVVEAFLIFFGSMAGQGSVLRWSYDHRLHHAHVDTDNDPYSINKGFWYAHFLWIFDKSREIESKVASDLLRNPLVMFQHKWYVTWMITTNVLAVLFVGWLCNDYLGAFVLAWWTRFFVLHHCTWFINSLAHTWGDKPFCQEQSAVNNYILALLTFGEGYHNYHHVFANDYRNGVRWYHYDPSKWLVWGLNKLGFAWDLKRVDAATISKRMVLERKSLLLQRLKSAYVEGKDELEKMIHTLSDQLVDQLSHFNKLYQDYQNSKGTSAAAQMRAEIKALKKRLHADFKSWTKLSNQVLSLAS